jgi:glycosyltransferase involved in cell wall biosynthesis
MITVGLPAVKPGHLGEAIQSIMDQTFTDFELIIVNDRRDQAVREIAAAFRDSRIRYIEEPEQLPMVDNWNRVLSYANGEYFCLFSDDDLYHPCFLAEMNALAGAYPRCSLYHCRVQKIAAGGEPEGLTALCPGFESGLDFIYQRLKGGREMFAPEFMVRTEKLLGIGGFFELPLAWGTDDLTWFQIAMDGGVVYSPRPFVSWRQSPGQVSVAGDVALRMEAVDLCDAWLRSFTEHYEPASEAERAAAVRIREAVPADTERKMMHLLAIHGAGGSIAGHLAFFFRNREKRRLKFRWLIYSLYRRIWKP